MGNISSKKSKKGSNFSTRSDRVKTCFINRNSDDIEDVDGYLILVKLACFAYAARLIQERPSSCRNPAGRYLHRKFEAIDGSPDESSRFELVLELPEMILFRQEECETHYRFDTSKDSDSKITRWIYTPAHCDENQVKIVDNDYVYINSWQQSGYKNWRYWSVQSILLYTMDIRHYEFPTQYSDVNKKLFVMTDQMLRLYGIRYNIDWTDDAFEMAKEYLESPYDYHGFEEFLEDFERLNAQDKERESVELEASQDIVHSH